MTESNNSIHSTMPDIDLEISEHLKIWKQNDVVV